MSNRLQIGSPSPILSWLVAWHRFNESGASVWSNWKPLDGQVSSQSSSLSRPSNDWPRSKQVNLADKGQLFVAASWLRFDRLSRRFYKAKLGCLASQSQLGRKPKLKDELKLELDLDSDLASQNPEPAKSFLPHKNQIAKSQSTNWIAGQTATKLAAKMIDEPISVSASEKETKDESGRNNESPPPPPKQQQWRHINWLELVVNRKY